MKISKKREKTTWKQIAKAVIKRDSAASDLETLVRVQHTTHKVKLELTNTCTEKPISFDGLDTKPYFDDKNVKWLPRVQADKLVIGAMFAYVEDPTVVYIKVNNKYCQRQDHYLRLVKDPSLLPIKNEPVIVGIVTDGNGKRLTFVSE